MQMGLFRCGDTELVRNLPNNIFRPILSMRKIVTIFPGRLEAAVKKLSM